MATEIIRQLKTQIKILIVTVIVLLGIICGINAYYVDKIEKIEKEYLIKEINFEYTIPEKVMPFSSKTLIILSAPLPIP